MTDLPFIAFPKPNTVERKSGGGFPRPTVRPPGRDRQRTRLAGRFTQLSERLATPAGLAELRNDPGSIAPERAVVLEIVDLDPTKVYRALGKLGFDLMDEDELLRLDAEFQKLPTPSGRDRSSEPVVHRLYFAMPGEQQVRSLVAMWRRYDRGEKFERGLTAWRDLFDHLSDIRPWGPQDRFDDSTLQEFAEDVAAFPDQPRRIEIELWYRNAAADRARASRSLRARIAAIGGRVLDEREIADILYHAILVELPARAMGDLIADRHLGFAAVDEIMLLRPQTLAPVSLSDLEPTAAPAGASPVPVEAREPIIAVFDGMPLTGHRYMTARLVLDDPDGHDARYQAHERQHGTEMASIILHGDANAPTQLPHRLYVRPVLVPVAGRECFPDDALAVYLIHRAFQRMLIGEPGVPASAPNVRIVNLSLGEPKRRFAGIVSPWARLLDRLAFDHRLLIFVSAGNVADVLPIPSVASAIAFEDMAAAERTSKVLASLLAEKTRRTLLSPAEAINAVTVGARHRDAIFNGSAGAMSVDPYDVDTLPNVTSALGPGAGRAAKPDLLMNGGRELVRANAGDTGIAIGPVTIGGRFCGIGAATSTRQGGVDAFRNTLGTSPATALATHEAARIEQSLRSMEDVRVDDVHLAVVLKALLGHSAAWSADASALLDGIAREGGLTSWLHRRLEQSRLLGIGSAEPGRVLAASEQRAVLLFAGEIQRDKTDEHVLPLPSTLSGKAEWREMRATLGWLTPVNFRHRGYRAAALSLDLAGFERGQAIGAEAPAAQPDEDLAGRGTLFHRRWSGEDPAVFDADQGLQLDVSCASPTGALDVPVPYALVVTVEVAATSAIDVYTEIKSRIGLPIRLRS